ncbi:MAG: UbiA family prenyltransferase [Planctomycetota bacterium]
MSTTANLDVVARPPLAASLVRLARPAQWSKSVFVLVGPAYGLAAALAEGRSPGPIIVAALLAAAAFGAAASGCYVINDLADREADRVHPRKRTRPIAAGHISPGQARLFAAALFGLAAVIVLAIPPTGAGSVLPLDARVLVGSVLALYVANVTAYSASFKHYRIADVMSLSFGFVLRVLAGCAAVAITPSTWLLNVTLFFSMFLAFGKRLGERRTLADDAGTHRRVQHRYTNELLRMAVVVTAVATLLTYAFYVQEQEVLYTIGFNLMWLTVLPVTFALLRVIVVLENGAYDDPTELAVHDRPFQVACVVFGLMTGGLLAWRIAGGIGEAA